MHIYQLNHFFFEFSGCCGIVPCHFSARTCDGKFYGAQPVSCPSAQQLQLRRAQVQKRGNYCSEAMFIAAY